MTKRPAEYDLNLWASDDPFLTTPLNTSKRLRTPDPAVTPPSDSSEQLTANGSEPLSRASLYPQPSIPIAQFQSRESPQPLICFGLLIITDFTLNADFTAKPGKSTCKPISLTPTGGAVIIRDATSNKYAGLLGKSSAMVINKLLREYQDVNLVSKLVSKSSMEVIVHGRRDDGDKIGDMLLDHDYYLQQPDPSDVEIGVGYWNPQMLMPSSERAGQCVDQEMWEPEVEESTEVDRKTTGSLNAKEKSAVAEMLDSAIGPAEFKHVQVTELLRAETKLKEHQEKALAMMVEKESGILQDAEFPSVWAEVRSPDFDGRTMYHNTVNNTRVLRKPRLCLGGLLADEMGLGKSLTTLALIAGSLSRTRLSEERSASTDATLIVGPMSTLGVWQDQIAKHFKPNSIRVHIYHGSNRAAGAHLLQDCDIVLTTYDTVRVDYARNEISESEEQAGVLHNVHWRRVVLDEAHVIRNRTSKVFKAICALKAIHRWCLTGTPIQNRLDDLGALAEFLRLDPFDSRSAFKNLSVNWRQIRLLFHAIALRRTKSLLTAQIQIPPRRNVVCPVFLDETEKQIYYLVQRHFALGMGSGGNIFQLVLRLRQVCNHGVELLPHRLREWVKKALTVGPQLLPVGDTVDDENCEFCAGEFTRGLQTLSCLHQICVTCMGQSTRSSDEGSLADCPVCDPASCSEPPRSPMNICESSSEIFQPIENQASSKIKALLKSLENDRTASLTSGKPQEKSVVFSAWTGMLDLTGRALLRNTFVFQRIDGNKSLAQRIQALQEFRHNSTCTVLLATLGSAGVGLDLTAASRVHIIEPGWNPMLERQAIDRVHRLGQQNEVVSTRYIVQSPDSKRESIEQFVERRQKLKTALVSASVGGSSMADEVGMNALIQDLSDVLHLDMAQV